MFLSFNHNWLHVIRDGKSHDTYKYSDQTAHWGNMSIICAFYSLIQMKCQGGSKCALSITVKFDQSTRRFGRISFAHLFKLTKHIALLFYLLSPYLPSCMRGSRNVRNNVHINKTIMKFCGHWSTVCGITNSDADGTRTQ